MEDLLRRGRIIGSVTTPLIPYDSAHRGWVPPSVINEAYSRRYSGQRSEDTSMNSAEEFDVCKHAFEKTYGPVQVTDKRTELLSRQMHELSLSGQDPNEIAESESDFASEEKARQEQRMQMQMERNYTATRRGAKSQKRFCSAFCCDVFPSSILGLGPPPQTE